MFMKGEQGQELFVRWLGMGTFLPYVSPLLSLFDVYLTVPNRCVCIGWLNVFERSAV